MVGRTLQQPAIALAIEGDLRVMSGGNFVGANLPRYYKKLVKLQVIVAQAARDRRASGKIFLNKRPHYVAFETLFVIDHVVGDAKSLSHTACVVDVIDRTAAPLDGFRHTGVSGETALVPELHGQADDAAPFGAQHGRNGRGVHSSPHSNGDGFRIQHPAVST